MVVGLLEDWCRTFRIVVSPYRGVSRTNKVRFGTRLGVGIRDVVKLDVGYDLASVLGRFGNCSLSA